jgi:hypothetical protein
MVGTSNTAANFTTTGQFRQYHRDCGLVGPIGAPVFAGELITAVIAPPPREPGVASYSLAR